MWNMWSWDAWTKKPVWNKAYFQVSEVEKSHIRLLSSYESVPYRYLHKTQKRKYFRLKKLVWKRCFSDTDFITKFESVPLHNTRTSVVTCFTETLTLDCSSCRSHSRSRFDTCQSGLSLNKENGNLFSAPEPRYCLSHASINKLALFPVLYIFCRIYTVSEMLFPDLNQFLW